MLLKQEVLDIEESVWAPRLGLKGNIDASLRLGMAADPHGAMQTWLQPNVPQQQQQQQQVGQECSRPQSQQQGSQQQLQRPLHPWQGGQQQGQLQSQQGVQHGQQQQRRLAAPKVPVQQALAPFEFKTGRPHHSHRAQVRGN